MAPHPTCHPSWIRAERRTRDWLVRFGLATEDAELRRLGRMGHGRLGGYVGGDPAEVALLAQWAAFVSVLDDGFDRDPARGRPAAVGAVLGRLAAVLAGAAPGDEPLERALGDLWRRSKASAARGWTARFAAHFAGFAAATRQEAALRESGAAPSLPEYLAMRRHTITALPLIAVVERALPEHPDELGEPRAAAADILAWANDLASAEEEHRAGHDNLVSVLARAYGCDRYEAAAHARTMIGRRMDDFDAAADALPPAMEPRVRTIRTFRDGALAWQAETQRNKSPRSAEGARRPGPADVRHGTDRLARYLAARVTPDGAVPDRCQSRVAESALLLALLRTRDRHPREQDRLRDYLRNERPAAGALDALLIDAVLDGTARRPVDTGTLGQVGGASRGRLKAATLQAILYVLCGAPLNPGDAPPPLPDGPATPYTRLNLLAVRTIHAHATGRAHAVPDAERSRLIDLLAGGGHRLVWEANATAQLLGLHALQTYRPGHPLLDDHVTALLMTQNPDGGIPPADGETVWLTALAGSSFLRNDALRPLTARMAGFVAAGQAADGGWVFTPGITPTDVDTATRCMEFLHAQDSYRHRDRLDAGDRYLRTMAGAGGGFATWVPGDHPDLDMTAGALLALAPRHIRHRDLLEAAAGFVCAAQRSDGTFEPSWTISESSVIVRTLDALHALPDPPPALAARIAATTARAVARLLATQRPDGGWGHAPGEPSDVLSTAQAVPALAGRADPAVLAAATGYLLGRQEADGSVDAPPDQVGPRPLPLDYRLVASVHTLTALTRAGDPVRVSTHTNFGMDGPGGAA